MIPPHAVGGGDEHFERGIARARAHPGKAGIDPADAVLHRDDRIGDAQAEIVVRVDATLGLGLQHAVIGLGPRGDIVHVHRAAAVGDVDAMRAVAFHQLGLLGERLGRGDVAHHQRARDVHAQPACIFDVLARDIGLGAVRRHTDGPHAHLIGVLQIVDRADAGEQQRRQHAVFQYLGNRADPVPIGMRAKPVIEAGALQPIAMRHLDRIDLGAVERAGDGTDVVEAVLVPDRVHAVAQRHVLDVELLRHRIEAHGPTLSANIGAARAAIRSAVRSAALVMMSRLPA